jgi:Domain of unknown function DUF11/Outer membrane lipoprotein
MTPAGHSQTPIHGLCALAGMSSAVIPRSIFSTLTKPVLCSLMIVLLGTGFAVAAETDDASLFVEAFTAYQKKDYLLAIEKLGIIDQLFPDTPLRDVVLLLQARSGLQSGDYELAATTINRFNSEFAANPLKSTIEVELLRLGTRRQKGERLLPAIPLRTAALKIRTAQSALERSTASKTGTEQTSQEAVRVAINLSGTAQTVAVGQRGEIPFEVVNPGASDEEFVLETSAPPAYETTLTIAGRPDTNPARATIKTAAPLKGSILFRMPPDQVDGYKAAVSLRVTPVKHQHIVETRKTQVITAAPLVRVVAKPDKLRLVPGERMHYHITVLNVGSLAARELTVRVLLPAQLELPSGDTTTFTREASGAIAFRVDALQTGKLVEFTLDVQLREDSLIGQELRSRVEVVDNQLQTKEVFTSAAAMVENTRAITVPVNRPR